MSPKRLAIHGLLIGMAISAGIVYVRLQREPPPSYAKVDSYRLTSSTEEAFDSANLRGKVWVANFIFTTCKGICPRLSSKMQALQRKFSSDMLRLVSVSVDPKTDTPAALRLYAKKNAADTRRWLFLTGEIAQVKNFMAKGLKIGSAEKAIHHSDRFVLVDQNATIRGYYSLNRTGDIAKLEGDLEFLLDQLSG